MGAGDRRDLAWCGGTFVFGMLLRAAHVWTIRDSPFFVRPILDPLVYDEWGLRIAGGQWLAAGPFFQDPLYAYFLGLIYAVAGHDYTVVAGIQALLGAAVAPLLLLAARPWFDAAACRAAAVLAAVYLPSLYYEGMILKTSLSVFLVALVLVLFSRAIRSDTGRDWLVAGVVLGLGVLTRGNLLLPAPVVALWIGLSMSRKAAMLVLAGCAVAIVPATLHNRVAGGEWILTTSNAGQNFYIGNNPHNVDGEYALLPFVGPRPQREEFDFAREAERRSGGSLSAGEVSRFWLGSGLAWVRGDPAGWLRLSWLKLRNFWGAYEIPDNLDFYLYRETAPILRLPIPGFGLIAPLALVGACLVRRRNGWPRLLLLFGGVYTASVVGFFVLSRFRMALMPVLFVLAGHAAVELARRVAAALRDPSRRGAAARAAGLFLFFFAFVNIPVRGVEGSRTLALARGVGLPARVESSATAHYNLGLSYAKQAKQASEDRDLLELAVGELRTAVDQGARYAKVHVELGKVLARLERNAEAIAAYEAAAELEPANPRIFYGIGLLQRREGGDLLAAEAAFSRVLKLDPRNTGAAAQLGELRSILARDADQ